MVHALFVRCLRLAGLTLLGLLAFAPAALAQTTATLAWDANSESDLAGYIVQYGTQAGNPTTNVDVGNVTTRQFSGLQVGVTYYFRVVAYNTTALQSGPSTEVSYMPAAPPAAPTLSSVSPTSGSTAGGTVITLNGANFVSGATVRVGGTSATGVTFLSATQLRATTPAGTAGVRSVQVTNPDTQSVTLNNAFTYVAPAPTVTAVSPTSGTTAGGTTITITGTNFVSGATVRVGGTSATGVAFVSATQLTATTPSGSAGAASVQVTNPDAQAGTLASGFTYAASAPSVTSVSPTSGTTAGGTTITINGANFVSGATVRVGGTSATGVTFVSATQLRANTPAGTAGAKSVQVTNPDAQVATLNNAFTHVAPAPTVTSVSPTSGTTLGGTTITINGANFVSGATVRVGGTSATGVTFVSATQLRANTPAGTAGAKSVQVTNPDTQSVTLNNAFTYVAPAPTVTAVSPTSGTTLGGTTITINGTNFVSGATVRVGGTSATGVAFVSATQLTATTPSGSAGAASVQVTNPDAQAGTLASGFTYAASAPSVTSVSPTSGTTAGGTTITINGANFVSGATVRVGGTSATGVTFVSATQLRANTPAGTAGAKSVQVTNPDTQAATLNNAFTYTAPAPTVTSVSPTSGTTLGGTTITINGTNFVSGATVRVGGTSATGVTFVSATQLRANTPAGTAGAKSVQVTNPDAQVATLNNAFTHVAPAPTVTSVSPTSGTTAGGTTITINGTNFVSGATVRVGGTSATGVTFVSATQLRANTPAGTAGAKSVQVTNPDAQAATLASAFTYVTPTVTPVLTSVSPASGTTAGGTTITLSGANFVAGATVRVGGAVATGVTFLSASQLRATTPSGAAGAASVQVTNPDAQIATLGGGFTYVSSAPALSGVSPTSGPATGGTVLTLTGTGFVSGATVRVGGVAATNVTFVSATQVRATTPAGAAGTVAVQLVNPDTQSASRGNAFTYTSAGPAVTSVNPASGPVAGGTLLTITGSGFVDGSGAIVRIGGVAATGYTYISATTLRVRTPAGTAGSKPVQVSNPNSQSAVLSDAFTYTDASSTDTDGDGLPDSWERQFGTDHTVATGADGASGDPDNDGVTNADEYSAGTHPRGIYQKYLAEGASNGFFNTRLAIANPQTIEAKVLVTFVDASGRTTRRMLPVPARSRRTVDARTVTELAGQSFATGIDSDQFVVMDRLMTWDGTSYGAHAETAVDRPSTVWYLAEGATGGPFDLFYLIQNPNNAAAEVEIRYLRSGGRAPVTKNYTVDAGSRFTVWVDQEDKDLASTDVSAVITSRNSVPVIVERSMYLSTWRKPFKGGHNSAAVTAPATSWFLAEGSTGSYFSMYVLVANPGEQPATVQATFIRDSGGPIVKTYTVAASSRYTIDVSGQDKSLRDATVAVRVESTNGQPIIVERTMWWPNTGGGWTEGHNAFGTTSTGPRWLLAEGEQGGARAAATYALIANTSTTDASVKVTVLFEDGAEQARTIAIPANRRYTVDVGSMFPAAIDKRFSVLVESQNPQTAGALVVERSMYWNTDAEIWGAGSNSLASKLP